MKYITTLFVFFGVWLSASVINGVLSGVCLSLYNSAAFGGGTFGLALMFSFIFSVPFVALVWFVTTVAQLAGSSGFALFHIVIITSFISALAGAVCFVMSFGHEFKQATNAAGLCIIAASITSVTIFRKQIKGYEETV